MFSSLLLGAQIWKYRIFTVILVPDGVAFQFLKDITYV